MDFDLTDEQRLIKDTAREFTDNEIVVQSRENARNHHFDLELVKKIADQGYLGAIVPQEYGGAGLDYLSYGLIVEEIGRGDSADPHRHLRADLARLLGDPQVGHRGAEAEVPAEALLRRVARLLRADRARHRLRRGQPEDARHEDRQRLGHQRREDVDLDGQLREGRADLRPDRPLARLQGTRVLPRRHRPARLQSAARSSTRWGCTPPTPPRSRSKTWRSPRTDMLGGIGDGFKVAMSALDSGRYSVAAGCVGICQGCVEESVKYAKEREQFGTPDRELPAGAGDDRRHGR